VSFKIQTVLAAVLSLALAAPAAFAESAPALSKNEIEQVVHDYIQAHPDEILDAVQSYQERTVRNKQQASVKTNRQTIYNDPLTPTAGNENGDVTVVEFFDYNCGYCKKVAPELLKLIEDDKKVRLLFKDFPILGPSSDAAAKWALAAHKQKKYLEFFKAMMDNKAPITESLLQGIAKDVGMDVNKAKQDAASSEILMQVERNRALAANMQIHGTPAFVVGDDLTPGAIGLDDIKELVAKARANAVKSGGDKPADKKPAK
jgi:protein-disulfide isomerase